MLENIKNDKKILAAGIDIGSNSIRMLIANVSNGKITDFLVSERATTRLASGINQSKKLSDSSISSSLEVLSKYKRILDNYNVTHIKAFATSAVREATNSDEFIEEVKKIGIPIEIISGIEEANIIYKGVNNALNIDRTTLIFDIGGGSTEFIATKDNNVFFAESYKIGVVKLVDAFNMKDDALKNLNDCKHYISDFLKNINLPTGIENIIATAGTATTIAAIKLKMKDYDWKKINGYTLSYDDIKELLYFIAKTDYDKRLNIVGMENGRQDLVIPGSLMMLEIMEKVNLDKVTISDFGLREGAVVTAANY